MFPRSCAATEAAHTAKVSAAKTRRGMRLLSQEPYRQVSARLECRELSPAPTLSVGLNTGSSDASDDNVFQNFPEQAVACKKAGKNEKNYSSVELWTLLLRLCVCTSAILL